MEEQLPIPALELILFHLFLSGITMAIGVVILFVLMKIKKTFTWGKYIFHSFLLAIASFLISIFMWLKWPFDFDIMLGAINLPSAISMIGILGLWYMFTKVPSNNESKE